MKSIVLGAICFALAWLPWAHARSHLRLQEAAHPARLAPADPAEDSKAYATAPIPDQRGAGRWPKLFYQTYRRDELATYHLGFTVVPSRERNGKGCFRVFFNMSSEIETKNGNYSDFLDQMALHQKARAGDGIESLIEGSPTGPFIKGSLSAGEMFQDTREGTPLSRKPKSPSFSVGTGFRHADYSPELEGAPRFLLVYIKAPGDRAGRINLGCIDHAGKYAGTVELAEKPGSPEKMEVPWSLELKNGDIPTIAFDLRAYAYPLPEGWTGAEYAPRPPLKPGEEPPPRLYYRLVDSSSGARTL